MNTTKVRHLPLSLLAPYANVGWLLSFDRDVHRDAIGSLSYKSAVPGLRDFIKNDIFLWNCKDYMLS
jgi:hypothetical protein